MHVDVHPRRRVSDLTRVNRLSINQTRCRRLTSTSENGEATLLVVALLVSALLVAGDAIATMLDVDADEVARTSVGLTTNVCATSVAAAAPDRVPAVTP